MTVKIVCVNCKKGLKIPETVLGKKTKCPSCAAVFVAALPPAPPPEPPPAPPPPEPPTLLPDLSLEDEPDRSEPEPVEEVAPVLSGVDDDEEAMPPPKKKTAVIVEEEDEPKPRKKAIILEEEDEEPKPKKQPAIVMEDEDEDEPKPKKKVPAVVEEDEDEPAKPAKKKKAAVVDEGDEEDKPKKKAKVKAPWYLFLFSLLPLVLVIGVPFGMPYFEVMNLDFMTDLYVGIGLGAGTMLLCLIFTVLPIKKWLRVLFVFFFLLCGFGGAAGWILYQRAENGIKGPIKKTENVPSITLQARIG